MRAPEPSNEKKRINNLYSYSILDTMPEEAFDDIVLLASSICDTPISAISLVDSNRQWFKSIKGLDVTETPRDVAFCAYTILGNDSFIVEDALNDSRFIDNELVTKDPKIRFYAGIPLISNEGYNLGTLCVIDKTPKQLTESQEKALKILAKKVITEINYHKAIKDQIEKTNIIEKMKAELEFNFSKTKSLIDSSEDFIFLIDKNKKLVLFNDNYKFNFEKSFARALYIGMPPEEYLVKNTLENWSKLLDFVFKGNKKIIESEISLNNSKSFFETTLNPVFFENEVIAVSVFTKNITKNKQFEKELIIEKEKAEKANNEKSIFLANMSHEIRNPLNGIISTIDIFEDKNLDEIQKDYLSILKASSESLLAIINDILDFSKIESKKMMLENDSFSLYKCVKSSCDILFYKAKVNNNKLSFNIDKNIPTYIKGDVARLRQILLNLIGNATKFTKNGYVEVNVLILDELSPEKISLRFEVKDNGIGIAEKKQKVLFSPYEQGNKKMFKDYGGTGLGLSISKNLVELMGGVIALESEEKVGSKFYFDIVFDVPNQEKVLEVSMESGMQDLVFKNYPLKILVVEDNQVNQKVLKLILNKLSYEPDIVSNGLEAVNICKKNKYDIIFMDIQMPIMDGIEATNEILLNKDKHLAIIAITGNTSEEDRNSYLAIGMKDYIIKPFSFDILKKVLLKWIYALKVEK